MYALALLGITVVDLVPYVRTRIDEVRRKVLWIAFVLVMLLEAFHLSVAAGILLVCAWFSIVASTLFLEPRATPERSPSLVISTAIGFLVVVAIVDYVGRGNSIFEILAAVAVLALTVVYGVLPALRARRLAR